MASGTHARDALLRRCRDRGIAVTLQRRAVLAAIAGRGDHPTADEVHAAVSRRVAGVSRATVYRTLETLVAHGLLVRVCHPEAACRYDARTHRHHHLVCDRCGAIRDLDAPALDALAVPDLTSAGFRLRDYSVHLRGLCRPCGRKATAASR